MEGNSSIARYVWFFVATNVAAIILLSVISAILEIDPGSAPSIAVFFMSTAVPAHVFVKDHQRAPTKAERTRLARWSFVAYFILSIVLLVLLLALPGPLLPKPLPEEAGTGSVVLIFLIVAAFGALIVYGILVLGYKIFSKQALKVWQKQTQSEHQNPTRCGPEVEEQ